MAVRWVFCKELRTIFDLYYGAVLRRRRPHHVSILSVRLSICPVPTFLRIVLGTWALTRTENEIPIVKILQGWPHSGRPLNAAPSCITNQPPRAGPTCMLVVITAAWRRPVKELTSCTALSWWSSLHLVSCCQSRYQRPSYPSNTRLAVQLEQLFILCHHHLHHCLPLYHRHHLLWPMSSLAHRQLSLRLESRWPRSRWDSLSSAICHWLNFNFSY